MFRRKLTAQHRRRIERSLQICSVILILILGVSAQNGSSGKSPLPCTLPLPGDTAPWVHNTEALSSFPKDPQLPRIIGSFRDARRDFWLFLYKDKNGIFGELLNPVFEADSPSSRLYDASLAKNGKLQFTAKFPEGQLLFSGVLGRKVLKGTFTRGKHAQNVVLKKLRKSPLHADGYVSRAQFDCEMKLFRRY